MMKDNSGQVALEYILIFAISLLLLIVFTLPLVQLSVENTLDISDTLSVKSDLSKIAQAVNQVYGEGQGSKQTIIISPPNDINLNIANNYISCNFKLKNGQSKQIRLNYKSTLEKNNMHLSKGENKIVVEWPVGSENMKIYTKLF